jgi:serine/threonine-protein kinase
MSDTLGQYKILELAGPVPLGEVYRARDTQVGRTVSVTIVAEAISSNPELRAHFLRGAQAAAAVSHPNIVTLYEVGEDGEDVFLVHEFMQGQPLTSVIAGRPLNPRRAVDLAGQIADGLADAHAADLVHGDLNADRIFITPKGNAKIAGFGLASWSGAAAPTVPSSDSALAAGRQADLASLGALLFEMLTGRRPSSGGAVPSAANRSLPREVDAIVARALGMSGGYESAVTLAAELRALGAVLEGRQEANAAAAASQRTGGRRRSKRAVVALIVGVLVLLAIGALAAYLVKPA